MTGGATPNRILRRMLELFLKLPPLKKILELYQLENKQAKVAKLDANIRSEVEGQKCSKIFFKLLGPSDRGQISIKLGTKHVI